MTKTNTVIAYLFVALFAVYLQQAAVALFLGIGLALTVGPAPIQNASKLSRGALQSGVVILGLALPFREVVSLGSSNGMIVSIMVLATLISGYVLLKLVRTDDTSGKLLTTGTAVCGGTAVATMAPVIKAPQSTSAIAISRGQIVLSDSSDICEPIRNRASAKRLLLTIEKPLLTSLSNWK